MVQRFWTTSLDIICDKNDFVTVSRMCLQINRKWQWRLPLLQCSVVINQQWLKLSPLKEWDIDYLKPRAHAHIVTSFFIFDECLRALIWQIKNCFLDRFMIINAQRKYSLFPKQVRVTLKSVTKTRKIIITTCIKQIYAGETLSLSLYSITETVGKCGILD